MFTIDTGLSLRSSNNAFLKLTGYPRRSRASLDEGLQVQEEQGRQRRSDDHIKTARAWGIGNRIPSGTLTLDWYYIPLLDENGAVDSLLVVFNDITERRRQELEIKKLMEDSQKTAQALSESAGVLEGGLSRMADGDLTFTAEIVEGDPLVILKKDYNKAILSIKSVIEEIRRPHTKLDVTTAIPGRARRRSPNPPSRWLSHAGIRRRGKKAVNGDRKGQQ